VDLFDVVRSCFRRWYVVLPLLLIALWFSHRVYNSAKPVYYSNAAVSVAPPNIQVPVGTPGAAVPRNGLEDVGGATLIPNLLVFGLSDPSVVAQVVAAGGQANYTVKMFPVPATSPELPLIMIEASEPDPIAASKTVALVVAQTDPALRTLQQQAGVPDDQMVKALVVSPPSAPAGGMPSRTKSTMTIAAAGAGIAILVGLVVDVLLMRWKAHRRNRRQTRVQTAGDADTADGVRSADAAVSADGARNVNPQNRHAADEVAMDSL
jgi:hypothetical protein